MVDTTSPLYENAWKIIGDINVALFAAFLLLGAYPIIAVARASFKQFRQITIPIGLLLLTKIGAGACALYALDHLKVFETDTGRNLIIASTVLSGVAPGWLMIATFKLVEYLNHLTRERAMSNGKPLRLKKIVKTLIANVPGTRLEAIEAFYGYLVTATLLLSSAGNGLIYKHFDTARGLTRAASILYLFELMILAGLFFHALKERSRSYTNRTKFTTIMTVLDVIAFLFIAVRVIASVCTAFTMKRGSSTAFPQSKFSYLWGDWKIYAFVAFMPECVASGVWVLIMWCLSRHLKYESSYASSSKDNFEDVA